MGSQKIRLSPTALAVGLGMVACFLLAVPFLRAEGDSPAGKRLRILCWENYFAPDTISNFEKETGTDVEIQTYGSNEDLYDMLTTGLVGVDIIFPSDYMVKKLIQENHLARLIPAKIPNFKNLSPRFLKLPYDKTNGYSVPYMWGTTGIGVNRSKVQGRADTLAILFDEQHKGRITMLDDYRTCIGMALKYLGKSANSRNKADLEAAKELLLKQKPLVAKYTSEGYAEALAEGESDLALGFNGDILSVRQKNFSVFYYVPEEGTVLWTDNICLLKTSDKIDLGHQFIDYLLRPDVSAAITNATFFASPNEAAEKLVKSEILRDRAIFPTKRIMDKSEFLENLGSAEQMYQDIWKEVVGE